MLRTILRKLRSPSPAQVEVSSSLEVGGALPRSRAEDYTQAIADDWKSSEYYDGVEREGALAIFWGEESPFKQMFDKLDVARVAEIACGHGRHLQKYHQRAEKVYLLDVNQENIDYCAKRHKALADKVSFVRTNGADLPGIADGSCTAVFSYDAMVHFEILDVIGYLQETNRVLSDGGMALFHHSNWIGNPGCAATKTHDFGWRNYMSAGLFLHLAQRVGLDTVQQRIIPWGGWNSLDCITLLRKAA